MDRRTSPFPPTTLSRRYPVGVELVSGVAHARVWAPRARHIDFVVEPNGEVSGSATPLTPEYNGYFSGEIESVGANTLYRFRLDNADAFPDPVSRFQPSGPFGPSQVIDPASFAWGDVEEEAPRTHRRNPSPVRRLTVS